MFSILDEVNSVVGDVGDVGGGVSGRGLSSTVGKAGARDSIRELSSTVGEVGVTRVVVHFDRLGKGILFGWVQGNPRFVASARSVLGLDVPLGGRSRDKVKLGRSILVPFLVIQLDPRTMSAPWSLVTLSRVGSEP